MNNNWHDIHQKYSTQEWANKPSIFAEQAKEYFPSNGKLLELGAGIGQDSIYFAEKGYEITSTDLDIELLTKRLSQTDTELKSLIDIQTINLINKLPFNNDAFDIVYAHLSLHYFDRSTTESLFSEIHRILKPGGILAYFTNSTSDPEFGTGKKIEHHYYDVDGMAKRYFDIEDAKSFAQLFNPLLVDNRGETYKDNAVGVHNLIRFVGRKDN